MQALRPENGPSLPVARYLCGAAQLQSLRFILDLPVPVLLGMLREHGMVGLDRDISGKPISREFRAGEHHSTRCDIRYNRPGIDWLHSMAPVPLCSWPDHYRVFRKNKISYQHEEPH